MRLMETAEKRTFDWHRRLHYWVLLTGYNYAAEIICILFCSNPKNPWSCTTRSKKRSNDCWESRNKYSIRIKVKPG